MQQNLSTSHPEQLRKTLDKHISASTCPQCNRDLSSSCCPLCGHCRQCCQGHLFSIGYGGLHSIEPLYYALKAFNIKTVYDIRRLNSGAFLHCFTSKALAEYLSRHLIIHLPYPELANAHNDLPWKPIDKTRVKEVLQLFATAIPKKKYPAAILCAENPGIDVNYLMERQRFRFRCHRINVVQAILKLLPQGWKAHDIYIDTRHTKNILDSTLSIELKGHAVATPIPIPHAKEEIV